MTRRRLSKSPAMSYPNRSLEDRGNGEAVAASCVIVRPSDQEPLKKTEPEQKPITAKEGNVFDEKYPVLGERIKYTIQQTDDNVSTYYGLRRSVFKTMLFYLLVILTGGLLYLVAYWKPKWKTTLTMSECSLRSATSIILEDDYGLITIADVQEILLKDNNILPNILDANKESSDFKRQNNRKNGKTYQSLNEEERSPGCFFRYFEYRHQRYMWSEEKQCFQLITAVENLVHFRDAYEMAQGLTRQEELYKLKIYDANMIDVLVQSYVKLFIDEAVNPFYVFQLFSCIMWFFDDYYYYAAAIILISLVSILTSVYQTRKHLVDLRNMIAKSSPVVVQRPGGKEEIISSNDIVPGDVIVLPSNGCHLHCDAVLLSGSAIVNESMLTGESIPVTKTPLPNPPLEKPDLNEVIDTLKHKRHTLFCGTELLQTRFYGQGKVLAFVVKTGYYTTKGNLIRSILFPKPVAFKFFSDALKFLGVLSIFATMGFIYTVYVFLEHGSSAGEIMLRALDVITIAVPPALPAAMSVGTIYALQRLKKVSIYCTSPSRINICGKIKLFCFDKTGTLTEDGLDIFGTIFAESGIFQELLRDISSLDSCEGVQCMASCHSLTYIDGKLTGDPLDMKMFEATGWQLEEAPSLQETEQYDCLVPAVVRSKVTEQGSHSYDESLPDVNKMPIEIAVLKQFTFSSELQRMSVIIRKLGKPSMDVFVKGSPEMIAKLCLPTSIPKDFDETLRYYAEEGLRVIAFGSKSLPESVKWHHVQHLVRNEAEKDLTFRGFLILKNMVKKETKPMIKSLIKSSIQVVMVTGDNMLTAVSVAKECGMIPSRKKIIQVTANVPEAPGSLPNVSYSLLGQAGSNQNLVGKQQMASNLLDFRGREYHFAMNGKTFSTIRNNLPQLYERILVCGTIFARMLPVQKAQLVEDLQSIGYTVGMCGDGANDCGALKVAHAGVSLSEAEASIASPFTSQIPNISCVAEIIKEGRCALVTSFSLFKYMAMYSMVQYLSVLLLYSVRSNLGDFQYLYIDLLIIMPFAITMSHTGPYPEIVARRPLGSLIHPLVLSSLILQILIQMTFQICLFFFIKTRGYYKSTDWYHAHTHHKEGQETQILSYENTVLFYLTSFQYIFLAVVLSLGKPYRSSILKNSWFVCTLIILSAFTLTLVLYPVGILKRVFQLVVIDDTNFIVAFFCWVGCNALLSFIVEAYLIKSERFRMFLGLSRKKKRPKNKYKLITIDFSLDDSWPPL